MCKYKPNFNDFHLYGKSKSRYLVPLSFSIAYVPNEDEEENYHGYEYDAELNIRKTFEDVIIHEVHIITHIPWKAIRFFNKAYTSDIFLKNAFRHEMGLPDDVWPKAWMNLSHKK